MILVVVTTARAQPANDPWSSGEVDSTDPSVEQCLTGLATYIHGMVGDQGVQQASPLADATRQVYDATASEWRNKAPFQQRHLRWVYVAVIVGCALQGMWLLFLPRLPRTLPAVRVGSGPLSPRRQWLLAGGGFAAAALASVVTAHLMKTSVEHERTALREAAAPFYKPEPPIEIATLDLQEGPCGQLWDARLGIGKRCTEYWQVSPDGQWVEDLPAGERFIQHDVAASLKALGTSCSDVRLPVGFDQPNSIVWRARLARDLGAVLTWGDFQPHASAINSWLRDGTRLDLSQMLTAYCASCDSKRFDKVVDELTGDNGTSHAWDGLKLAATRCALPAAGLLILTLLWGAARWLELGHGSRLAQACTTLSAWSCFALAGWFLWSCLR